ncbi:unknown protein [Bathycoccus prasinos]|uniref:Uncharacterized protein n=1 Tax=Bathycoccus prasinos TaxID=41875 RepID=K8EHD4_9CHLO|nr:unknown protein [Bathycoccus prasinos]CCO17411.1 unknown protein [Bathycoccus prasinos]|eukprot:XP_007512811.1 unknown protein [Bathycoccus prasinos]
MVGQTQPSVTYKQTNGDKNKIPFWYTAFHFVEWGLLRKDERKEKIDALMRAKKFGLGNGFQSGWTTYKTYDPEEGEEEYRNSKIEGAFSNAYILASLPENVLPIDQRNENGDKKWINIFRNMKTRNIDSQINMIPWANLPEAYASAAWFNKDNTLAAFGLGTEEQKVAFKERKKERVAKVGQAVGQARRAKQEDLNKLPAGPRIVDPRLKKEEENVYHAMCLPFYCSCTNVSWNKNKTCRSIDGEFDGKACSYGVYSVVDGRTGCSVSPYVELTEEKVKNLVNFKCLFIECKCELGDNCRCETIVNGKRGGYMSEVWLNRITEDRVRNCTEDSLETMMNAKCKFIECKCNRGKEKGGCRCTVHRGVLPFGRQRGGWASSTWFDSETEEQVYSFNKETLKTIMSGRCLERECDNCGRKGFASGIYRPSPLTKGKFFCRSCAEFDVFEDERGCGICCRRLYVCKLSPEQMKDNMRRHKIKEKYMKKVVTAPKTLERDVHESCFRILRNDMIDRKEEKEREKCMRKFAGKNGEDIEKNLDKLADEFQKLI